MIKTIVVGPLGKMGRLITQVAAESAELELVAGVGPQGRVYIGEDLGQMTFGRTLAVPIVDDLAEVIDFCDVIIDFSTKEMGLDVLRLAQAHHKALVCGTTGFAPEEKACSKKLVKIFLFYTPPTRQN